MGSAQAACCQCAQAAPAAVIREGTTPEAKSQRAGQSQSQAAGKDREGEAVSPGARKSVKKATKGGAYTREELEESFDKTDRDGNGTLDKQEMASLLEDMKVKFTIKKVNQLFKAMDTDGGGTVGKDEFCGFFVGKEKKLGLGKIIQAFLDGEKEDGRGDGKKPVDVCIIDGMCSEDNGKRAEWATEVLEFADIKCAGDYAMADCACAVVFLDGEVEPSSSRGVEVMTKLKKLKKAELQTVCFYEAGPDVWSNLKGWQKPAQHIFERTAVAISMHFLSDSEQLVLNNACEMLGTQAPMLFELRPPGGDLGDFSSLGMPSIRWLQLEHALGLTQGKDVKSLPDDAFTLPSSVRTCFISYAQEKAEKPGLAPAQQERLEAALKRNGLSTNERMFFMDPVSLAGGILSDDYPGLCDVLSLSRFIILDETSSSVPYLERGSCFVEAVIVMLTGCLAPCRDGQFVEIDKAIGGQLQKGANLRKFFRDNVKSPHSFFEALSAALQDKKFADEHEAERAQMLVRQVLERHPLLVPGPALQAKRPKNRRCTM